MNTEQKIEAIKEAIEKADKMQSPHAANTYQVPALTSLKIRHLLNNIGRLGTNYLEIGVHRGGTFTASIAGNENLEFITAIDSFESDKNGENARVDFLANVQAHKPYNTNFDLIVSDSFSVDIGQTGKVPELIDIYLYDGDHSEESQKKALGYYLPNLANEFIFMVDDNDWPEVQKGTQDGIRECGLEILFEKYLVGNNHDNDGYWNGFYVAFLRKKK